jgi:hypothetical protein
MSSLLVSASRWLTEYSTKGFRDFFFQFNKDLMSGQLPTSRKAIIAEVVQVEENATQLDPLTEIAQIQRIINSHNSQVQAGTTPPGMPPYQIKKTVFYTGYMIAKDMSDKLASLVKLPQGTPEGDVRYLANSILITPKPAPKSILDKVGGIGNKVVWKVTGISCFENKLWAARVEPIPRTTKFYSENPSPTVVLALRKGGRPADAARIQNWHPVPEEEAHIFESVVGEKVVLRIEEEHANESRYESYFPNKGYNKRAHSEDGNGRPPQQRPKGPGGYRGGNRDRGHGGYRNPPYGSRGGRGGGGHRGDRGGRGRGRGAPSSSYRSLDDVDRNGPGQAGPDSYY